MAITRTQLAEILEQWRMEYGYGGCDAMAEERPGEGVGASSAPVLIGTVADDFQAEWVKLSTGSVRDWRIAMALKADVFARQSDPIRLILDRLRAIGILMQEQEFADHVEWAKVYFCQVMTIRPTARKSVLPQGAYC